MAETGKVKPERDTPKMPHNEQRRVENGICPTKIPKTKMGNT